MLKTSLKNSLKAVILAGGSGTRFWPISRRACPKQFISLLGKESTTSDSTLLGATIERIAPSIPPAQCYIVTGSSHVANCRKTVPQLEPEQLIVEPCARNTAGAIGLAAIELEAAASKSATPPLMVVLPADHYVRDADLFNQALLQAASLAATGKIVMLGIEPTQPETGYGYIERGAALTLPATNPTTTSIDTHTWPFYKVKRFTEKPDYHTAKEFIATGNFAWNAGIFVMSPRVYLEAVATYMPELSSVLQELLAALKLADNRATFKQLLAAKYASVPNTSIDYGIMEKLVDESATTAPSEVVVLPLACGWSDLGSFSALSSILPSDEHNNVVHGRAILQDTHDCIVYVAEGQILTCLGLKDLILVHTADVTLALPKERAQEVKTLLAALQAQNWTEYL